MYIPSRKCWSEVRGSASYHELLPAIANVVEAIARKGSCGGGAPVHQLWKEFCCPPAGPGVSLQDFFIRLCKYALCSGNAFILMAVLIDRIATRTYFQITEHTIHKLILGVFVISVKLTEDRCYGNSYYAGIGGLSTATLNALEKHTLQLLNWDLHVDEGEYRAYLRNFEAYIQSTRIECA